MLSGLPRLIPKESDRIVFAPIATAAARASLTLCVYGHPVNGRAMNLYPFVWI